VFNHIKKSTGATASAKNTLQYESISLDIMAREVFIHNKKIRIGKIPYLMLFKFISTPETVIPPEKLIEYLWGDEALFEEQSNSILRVHIHNLKKLLEKHESVTIENVYGYGYKLHNPLVSS
jgi:two-component system OmpR family response regulator